MNSTTDTQAMLLSQVQEIAKTLESSMDEAVTDEMLEGILGMEWTVDQENNVLGTRLLVAFGGPNIWVDTRDKEVQGYWGQGKVYENLSEAVCTWVDDAFADLRSC